MDFDRTPKGRAAASGYGRYGSVHGLEDSMGIEHLGQWELA